MGSINWKSFFMGVLAVYLFNFLMARVGGMGGSSRRAA